MNEVGRKSHFLINSSLPSSVLMVAANTQQNGIQDGPLDFSTKKFKDDSDSGSSNNSHHHAEDLSPPPFLSSSSPSQNDLPTTTMEEDTSCRRLCNILTMNCSPVVSSPPIMSPLPVIVDSNFSNSNNNLSLQFPVNETTTNNLLHSAIINATSTPINSSSKARSTRPFKAYPKDPLTFPTLGLYGLSSPIGTEAFLHQQSNQAYAEFRKQMLSQSHGVRARRGTGGSLRNSDSNSISGSLADLQDLTAKSPSSNDSLKYELMDTGARCSSDGNCSEDGNGLLRQGKTEQQLKDEAYWERRRKNNEAAKRSRDSRRAKEDEIAIRAAFLEQENLKLRFELCTLKNEIAKLRCVLYSS